MLLSEEFKRRLKKLAGLIKENVEIASDEAVVVKCPQEKSSKFIHELKSYVSKFDGIIEPLKIEYDGPIKEVKRDENGNLVSYKYYNISIKKPDILKIGDAKVIGIFDSKSNKFKHLNGDDFDEPKAICQYCNGKSDDWSDYIVMLNGGIHKFVGVNCMQNEFGISPVKIHKASSFVYNFSDIISKIESSVLKIEPKIISGKRNMISYIKLLNFISEFITKNGYNERTKEAIINKVSSELGNEDFWRKISDDETLKNEFYLFLKNHAKEKLRYIDITFKSISHSDEVRVDSISKVIDSFIDFLKSKKSIASDYIAEIGDFIENIKCKIVAIGPRFFQGIKIENSYSVIMTTEDGYFLQYKGSKLNNLNIGDGVLIKRAEVYDHFFSDRYQRKVSTIKLKANEFITKKKAR
jgi:hypothetical protein